MNPVDEFVYQFEKLFPDSVLVVDDKNEEITFYHNAPVQTTVSDECALEHLSTELGKAGVKHWLVRMNY